MSQERISQHIELKNEIETRLFAQDLSVILRSGDCVCLSGALGVGKTTLAREIIRCIARDGEIEVPSPTYTLQQVYDTFPAIYHYDFYRLNDAAEVDELAVDEALDNGIVLIEWPQIYAEQLPGDAIHIEIAAGKNETRSISLHGSQEFMDRYFRSNDIRNFLDLGWTTGVTRTPLMGDASTRAYELVQKGDEVRVLMNSKKMPDGPVIREFGKPYSQIAHLAEEVSAFVGVDRLLRGQGFNAPEIYAEDLTKGFLLTEYLGNEPVISEEREPIAKRYLVAIELLAKLHQCEWPSSVQLENHRGHCFERYDNSAVLIEVGLLTEWFIPDLLSRNCNSDELGEFQEIWRALYTIIASSPQTLVLRDFHSPNLIWQEHKEDTNRISLIDFQDALMGPESYDVASLAQDARVSVDENLEKRLVDHYIACRKQVHGNFDDAQFLQSYAIMAAQRATKILGIFVRLHKRDKKPAYLKHIPRIRTYLERSFAHPVLSDYKSWFERITNESSR